MTRCEKCGCAGRTAAVKDGVRQLVCANPRCGNYKQVFAERPVETPAPDEQDKKARLP